ncbi:hypothetical protein acdb102_43510 [Acidothermaceae bacterium B102]|nr:hypothetical protein acdb102_43510 [Acidothermaceae bacterium B102]
MSKIKRLRAVLTGAVSAAVAVSMLPVLAVTAHAAADPLGGQPGPVTLSPTMATDTNLPTPPAGTSLDDFVRHPVLSWTAITTLPVSTYHVQISPNAEFTNNTVTLPNGGLTTATQYDLPQTLPHGSYFWRVRGEDAAGHATLWTGAGENQLNSTWQFTKTWLDAPTGLSPAYGAMNVVGRTFSWDPMLDASAYQFELSTNPDFPTSDPVETTWICETNHTSITPFIKSPFGEAVVADGTVIGGCGDGTVLDKALQLGGTWYWKVRGIDGTTAALTPADGAVNCSSDGSDCSLSSDVQQITLAAQVMTNPSSPSVLTTPVGETAGCAYSLVGGLNEPLCYDTPTLTWNPVATANAYYVALATDPAFSTDYHAYISFDNAFTPRESIFDNQAGNSYYWYVKACFYNPGTAHLVCGPPDQYDYIFHKASPALPSTPASSSTSTYGHNGLYVTTDNNQTFASAVHQVRGNQLTFHWDDLLAYTEQAGIQSDQEARNYRLQYTTTGDWLTATSVDVDGTHWTKTDGVLPDGGYYWRVAPMDGSGNVLSWSATQTLAKGTVAPTVSIGETGFLAPTSLVNLVFAAPVTGVTAASLGLRQVGGGNIPGTLVWPSTGPTTATFKPTNPLLPGEKVVPWVTSAVVDLAGNAAQASPISAQVDPTVDSLAPTITTTWSKVVSGHASGGSYAKAAGARDQISFSFTGSSISLIGVRTPDGGYATLSVDGVPRKTVNFFSKKTAYGVTLYSGLLSEGTHVVTVTVKASHPKGSTGNAVNVDALKVDGKLMQQTAADQIWSLHRSTDAYKGSYNAESSYLSSWKGSKPTLSTTFSGSAVHIVGCKSPDGGNLAVYVDGKLKATDSTFQKFTSCNKTLVKIGGLSGGSHTVTITPLGTHAKASSGTKVSVDAIVAG